MKTFVDLILNLRERKHHRVQARIRGSFVLMSSAMSTALNIS